MSQKTKYIMSAVCGFLAILAIGAGAIVLLRAKRTVAPEIQQSTVQQTPANAEVAKQVQDLRKEQFSVPTEKKAEPSTLSVLPSVLQQVFSKPGGNLQVYAVEYVDGSQGFRIEQDVDEPLQAVYSAWQKQLLDAKQLVSAKSDSSETMMSAKVGAYKLVFVFSKLTETTTGQTIRAVSIPN